MKTPRLTTKTMLREENRVLREVLSVTLAQAQEMADKFAEHDRELHARIEELERRHERPLDDNRGQYL